MNGPIATHFLHFLALQCTKCRSAQPPIDALSALRAYRRSAEVHGGGSAVSAEVEIFNKFGVTR